MPQLVVCILASHFWSIVNIHTFSPEQEESAMVHAASVLPHHLSGTIYRDTSETMTLVVNNLLAIWRHFCLHGPIHQRHLWERLA